MGWLERHRGNIAAFVVVLVAVAAMVILQLPRRPALQVSPPASPPVPQSIKVHVTGAVLLPGVVQLSADARVEDALRAAGGPSPSAEMAGVNLALPLRDGQQVAIPEKGAPAVVPPPAAAPPIAGSPQATPVRLIDINTASQKELETLPGIGPATAQKILSYRESSGGFRSIEELRDAKLVNAPTWEKIRTLVEVR